MKQSQLEQKQKVDEALESVEKAVADLQESGRRREADLRSFKSDIDSIRELIPKVWIPFDFDVDFYRRWRGIKRLRRISCRIYRMS